MKRSHICLMLMVLVSSTCFATKYHSTYEVLSLLTESKIGYEIGLLKKDIPPKDYSENLNHNLYYRVEEPGVLKTVMYNFDNPYYKRAETYFENDKDSALYLYKLCYDVDTTFYVVLTYMGQMYDNLGDRSKAIGCYKQAIEKNYIDYMAHWFLADDYLLMGEIDKAVDEITIALILNRNNPRILKSLHTIYKKAGLSYTDWYFNPQVRLTKLDDNSATIESDEVWAAYAMTQALWLFEPGYKESMGVDVEKSTTTEYTECLVNLYVSLDKKMKIINKDPQLATLIKVIEENSVNLTPYILYEIFLPEHPMVAYQFPESLIAEIKDYIKTIRR